MFKVNGVARLTRDVELKYLPSSKPLAKFGLATSKKYKEQDGTNADEVCFIDATVFGKKAEVCNSYLRKGSQIWIDATLIFEQWEANDGSNRNRHTLRVNEFKFLDSKDSVPQQNEYKQNGDYNENYNNQSYNQSEHQDQLPTIDIDNYEIAY